MPITQSAKKALRVSGRKSAINRRRKAVIKAALKIASKETLPQAVSLIDKAVKWGIFHKNKAARLKSRLSLQIGQTPGVSKTKGTDKSASAAKTKPKATPKKPAAKAKKSTPKSKKS